MIKMRAGGDLKPRFENKKTKIENEIWPRLDARPLVPIQELDDFRSGGIDRVAEAFHDGIDQRSIHDVRRRQ